MFGQIDLATDRPEEQSLLALAEVLMAGFVFGRDEFVGLREAVFRVESRVMDAKRVGEPLRPYLPPDVAKRLVPPRRDAVDGAILLAGGTLDETQDAPCP